MTKRLISSRFRSHFSSKTPSTSLYFQYPQRKEIPVITELSATTTTKIDKSNISERLKRFSWDHTFPYQKENFDPHDVQIHTTTLSNGLRVVTQNQPGHSATFGVLINAGSRFESVIQPGITLLTELMSFKSTYNRSAEQVLQELGSMGAMQTVQGSREELFLIIDVMKNNIAPAVELFSDCILSPVFQAEEIEYAKSTMEFILNHQKGDAMVKELAHKAAFRNQPMGIQRFARPEEIDLLNVRHLHEFRSKFLNSSRMIVVGVGVEHNMFVDLINKYFYAIPSQGSEVIKAEPAKYTGGFAIQTCTSEEFDPFTYGLLAFQGPSLHDIENLTTAFVVSRLLGGGSSFSGGGPGKGMYSRLFTEVLGTHHWIESANSFIQPYSDTGLFGISASCEAEFIPEIIQVMFSQLYNLSTTPVEEEEFTRAKNLLKTNTLMSLESRIALFEDIARQTLLYGKVQSAQETCLLVDRITQQNVMDFGKDLIKMNPTIAVHGKDTDKVPARFIREIEKLNVVSPSTSL